MANRYLLATPERNGRNVTGRSVVVNRSFVEHYMKQGETPARNAYQPTVWSVTSLPPPHHIRLLRP